MITQEEKVDQVRSVTLDCQWGTGERLRQAHLIYLLVRECFALTVSPFNSPLVVPINPFIFQA
ncbi:hypothetical protein [Vibrio anguillarum]|uniref:hypothetical protein n=1 Tax=Vibrio anguillarum TaxID=55601 RepID=UPI000BB4ABB6|nr:hypothetical protein [Vibrio anguillarum]ATC57664.1 hypothetical protein CMV05_08600 [Vibrio anguillarum]